MAETMIMAVQEVIIRLLRMIDHSIVILDIISQFFHAIMRLHSEIKQNLITLIFCQKSFTPFIV